MFVSNGVSSAIGTGAGCCWRTASPSAGTAARRNALRARTARPSMRATSPSPDSASRNPTRLTPAWDADWSGGRRGFRRSARRLDGPVEQRSHDAAPLTAEGAARRVALAGIQHVERDRLVDAAWCWSFGKSMLQIAASTITEPFVEEVPGYPRGRHVVARRRRLVPALVRVHRVERDAPSLSSTLIFGKTGLSARSTLKAISTPTGSRDVDDARRHARLRPTHGRRGLRRVVAGRGLVVPGALRARAVRLVEVARR